MSDDWKWESWEPLGDDDPVEGPPEEDHYDGPHGLKPGVENSFKIVL